MATEGTAAVVEAPASPTVPAGAAPDPKVTPDAGGKPAASQPEPKWEDDPRVKAMLADLKKERTARQEFDRQLAEHKAQLAEEKRRVAALTGITPPNKAEADAEEVRARLKELIPELGELGSIAEIRQALEDQQVQMHADHSRGMLAKIHAAVAAEYGDLTPRQKERINAAYLYANQTNPELHQRHVAGDPALIEEFAKDFIADMVEPIKKKTAASDAMRFRPVPGGRDRSMPSKSEKPKTSEELMAAKWRAQR